MEKLERDNRQEVDFLDEVNKRCYYSNLEYYYDPGAILEGALDVLDVKDPRELLREAFWLYFWKEQELMWLEVALISSIVSSEFPKDVLKERLWMMGKEAYQLLRKKSLVIIKFEKMLLLNYGKHCSKTIKGLQRHEKLLKKRVLLNRRKKQ